MKDLEQIIYIIKNKGNCPPGVTACDDCVLDNFIYNARIIGLTGSVCLRVAEKQLSKYEQEDMFDILL